MEEVYYTYIRTGTSNTVTTNLNVPLTVDDNADYFIKIIQYYGRSSSGNSSIHILMSQTNDKNFNNVTYIGNTLGSFAMSGTYYTATDPLYQDSLSLPIDRSFFQNPTATFTIADLNYTPIASVYNIVFTIAIYAVGTLRGKRSRKPLIAPRIKDTYFTWFKFGANSSITGQLNLPEEVNENTYFKITKIIGKATASQVISISSPELADISIYNASSKKNDTLGLYYCRGGYVLYIAEILENSVGYKLPQSVSNNPIITLYLTDESSNTFVPLNLEIEIAVTQYF